MKTFIAFLLAGGLVGLLIYLCSLLPAPAASSTIHQTIDNHTQVIITNNMPTDFSGIALTIISIAILIYVIGVVTKTIMELRRRRP